MDQVGDRKLNEAIKVPEMQRLVLSRLQYRKRQLSQWYNRPIFVSILLKCNEFHLNLFSII